MPRRRLALLALTVLVACGQSAPTAIRSVGSTSTVAATILPESTSTTTEAPTTTDAPSTTVARVRATTTVPAAPRAAAASPVRTGTGACGGDLPPCVVMNRESGGDPTAIGYGQCDNGPCEGKWQLDPVTRASLGYDRPMYTYPEDVQDDAARALKARDGCGAWSTC